MFLIGDIGNTEVKIVLFNNKKKILKRFILKTNELNNRYLSKKILINKKYLNKIQKILFSSVVPVAFLQFKFFFKKKTKKKML